MTLFDVAKKNVKGNFKSYMLYFLSMIFTVVIYYTFVSLQYSKEIEANTQSWVGMRSVFFQASFILILFAAVFIWYSNSFFTKKRKKEVGLYSLLGVRKSTIGKMLFYENLLMGTAALAIGIVLGSLLSKLFSMIFLKLLDSAVEVSFSVSAEAIVNAVIVFAVIILFTSIQSYRLIYRFRLVELFQAEKEGEQAPKASLAVAGIAVVLLAFGYWLAFLPIETTEKFLRNIGLLFISIIVGTYLLFRSAIIYLLRLAQKNKSRYYKGMNLVDATQLLYRIRGNTRMFTMIALLSALTLCALSVGISQYFNVVDNAKREAPFSYMHISQNEEFDRQVGQIISGDTEHKVTASLDVPLLLITGDLSEISYHPTGYPVDEVPIKLLSASTYNQASEALNREGPVQLADGQAIAIQPMYTSLDPSDIEGRAVIIPSPQGIQTATFTGLVQGRVLPWGFPDVCVVVSDALYDELAKSKSYESVTYKGYKVTGEGTSKETSTALMAMKTEASQMSTYYSQYRQNLESAGLNIFTLGFLGLVFLAATGSIIYFKQLTDAHADKRRYEILRNIGVNRRQVRASVAKQTLFVFLLPLILGILHSSMILKALASIQLIVGDLIVPVVISMIAYAVIYLGYYVLCVNSYNRIVNK